MNTEIHINIKEAENLLNSINNSDTIQFSEWTKEKANLRYNGKLPGFPIYNNFIYWCNLGINIGSEQNKLRPINDKIRMYKKWKIKMYKIVQK